MKRVAAAGALSAALLLVSLMLIGIGVAVGSSGLAAPWGGDATEAHILWQIRLPRTLGAWLAGALLGLAGAAAQGLFRNPLAEPFLIGSSAGAALAVAALLAAVSAVPGAAVFSAHLGTTGAAFVGAAAGVLLTLSLARGVQHTVRLLLAGVVVSVVLGAAVSLIMVAVPDILRTLQAFMLGSTGLLGWSGVAVLAGALALTLPAAAGCGRALDALALGEAAARSLGVPMARVRGVLVGVLALATGAAVAQTGMVAFVGLVAPHLVRARCHPTHTALLGLSALAGGVLLLGADLAARTVLAPQELPVGVFTAFLGGSYLLWLMHRHPASEET